MQFGAPSWLQTLERRRERRRFIRLHRDPKLGLGPPDLLKLDSHKACQLIAAHLQSRAHPLVCGAIALCQQHAQHLIASVVELCPHALCDLGRRALQIHRCHRLECTERLLAAACRLRRDERRLERLTHFELREPCRELAYLVAPLQRWPIGRRPVLIERRSDVEDGGPTPRSSPSLP